MSELTPEARERLAVLYEEFRRLVPVCLIGSDLSVGRSYVLHISATRYGKIGKRLLFSNRPLCGSHGAPFILITDPGDHPFRIVCRRCARIACRLMLQVNEGKEQVDVGS